MAGAIKDITRIGETFTEARDGTAKALVKYTIETTEYMTANAILAAASNPALSNPLPARLASYSSSRPFCLCVLRELERLANTIVEASLYFEDPTTFAGVGDPTATPAKIVLGVGEEMVEKEYDGRGNRVKNSAGSRFSRPPTFPEQTAIYSVTKIVNDATKAAIKAAVGTLNNAAKTIDGDNWEAGELWLKLPRDAFTPVSVGGTNYHTASYTLLGKRGGWKYEVADIGNVNKFGKTPNQAIPSLSGKPNPPMGWPLDGVGVFMANHNDDPYKLTFWMAPENAWTGVPLS